MIIHIRVEKGRIIIQARGETDNVVVVVGDMDFQINPGETFELDGYKKTYEELVEQGSGEFKI